VPARVVTVAAGQRWRLSAAAGRARRASSTCCPRFYGCQRAAAILIDGTDIKRVGLASLREQIGMVTQETVLFDDTIAATSRTAGPTRPGAIEAARPRARAHDFISPAKRYETVIGDAGTVVRGPAPAAGHRPRAAQGLADPDPGRGDLRRSDSESEALVQDALANLMRNRTSFVIAHRLSTIQQADVIIVLERGRIAEVGTPRGPAREDPDGVYAALHAMQFRRAAPRRHPLRKTGA